jgi:SAM-dependent methyltransferase
MALACRAATVQGVATWPERSMSFGTIAADYDRLRPRPAVAAVAWLVPERCQVAVDLGAGTGLLSRALARTVPRVVAVEPDPRMAAVLRARSPGVYVVQGQGERIPVRGGSADGVFVSSAWQWMDPERAAAEVWRVLRPGGRFGLVWTSVDRHEGWPDGAACWPQRRFEIRLPEDGFEDADTAVFTYRRPMTTGDIVAMLATYSHVITAGPRDKEAVLASARARIEQRFPGAQSIDVPVRSRCWRARRTEERSQNAPEGRAPDF